MSDLQTLERLKIIAEHNLEMSKAISKNYPKLEEKYRNIVAKITLEIAEQRSLAAKRALKPRKRGQA